MSVQLGSISLEHLTDVEVQERARLARHAVPALGGDLIQQLGRSSVDLMLAGSFFGTDAATQLADLRAVFRDASPVDLAAEAAGDGYVTRVVVTGLEVRQHPRDIERFDYRVALCEYVEPPPQPTVGPLSGIDGDLAQEAAGYLDDVQNGLAQVSQLVSLTQIAGFGDPTTKAPKMLDTYKDAGGGQTGPADAVRDVL
ncbi:MAG: hypothetical protein ACXVW7_10530 [Trebonia sp.]